MDTQWPRFIVFLQERANTPHQYVGSVHAPDADMALLNARDVFVRRPACVSLWVVPSSDILMKTAEELAHEPVSEQPAEHESGMIEDYHVFYKLSEKGTFIHAGVVNAHSPETALRSAYAAPTGQAAKAVWVFPIRSVVSSSPEDVPPMFAPAYDKILYRDQGEFHITTAMQQIKRGQDDED